MKVSIIENNYEPTPWIIERIGKGLKFSHREIERPVYISDYKIAGEGVYKGERPPSALNVIGKFINKIPDSLGFQYENWDIEIVDGGLHSFLKKGSDIVDDEYFDYQTLEKIEFGLFLSRLKLGEKAYTEKGQYDDNRKTSGKLGWRDTER